ncbi:MAG: hypothetical protein JRJ03_00595 [Deltaproteobacteria bacterium]|nr:hypothetical protein [Deltaproteobacteria bacterium]
MTEMSTFRLFTKPSRFISTIGDESGNFNGKDAKPLKKHEEILTCGSLNKLPRDEISPHPTGP